MSVIPPAFYNDRGSRGRLRFTGRDRQSFLQGMVSNDVAALAPGHGCYAFVLDATGHVLADLRVLCADNYLLLDTEPGTASFVAETLDRYLIMEKCRITDVSDEMAQIFVGGEGAPALLKRLFDVAEPELWPEGANVAVGDGATLIASTRWIPGPGYDLYVPLSQKTATIAALESAGAVPIADELLEALRIEAGVPRSGIDIDSKALAPETGQQTRAISYRKGCYIGQEIVARIHARGHANRTFAGFLLSSAALPEPGATVESEGRDVGRITSAVVSPTLGRGIALGYVRNEFSATGTQVFVDGQPAEVAALPFVHA
jgi:folate-binding protein YgfZ